MRCGQLAIFYSKFAYEVQIVCTQATQIVKDTVGDNLLDIDSCFLVHKPLSCEAKAEASPANM